MNWIDHMDIVRILLENGIDVNAANDKGSGALHAAAGTGIFNQFIQCFRVSVSITLTRPFEWIIICGIP